MSVKKCLICIIILNWNQKNVTEECINSILEETEKENFDYKIVLVDNGSEDGSVDYLNKKYRKLIDIISLDKNYGYSIGMDVGIEFSIKKYNPNYMLFLNNDMKIVQKDWIKKMLKIINSSSSIGAVGCNLVFPDGSLQFDGVKNFDRLTMPFSVIAKKYKKYKKDTEPVFVLTGAPLLVKRQILEKTGFYDIIFTPSSNEEIELMIRIRKNKYYLIQCYDVKVVHYLSLAWKKFTEIFRFFLVRRNHFIMFLKHYKKFLPIVLFFAVLVSVIDKKDEKGPIQIHNIRLRRFAPKMVISTFLALIEAIRVMFNSYSCCYLGVFKTINVKGKNLVRISNLEKKNKYIAKNYISWRREKNLLKWL